MAKLLRIGTLRLFFLTAALVVASALAAGLSSAAPSALPRATEDRPDEVAGEQVHFLYVIPTDAPDEHLDVNGELTTSIARMQAWLARQTRGPKLRLDTYQGQPDITFVRTSLEPIFDEDHTIRQYVERLGFANPSKLYLMYFSTYGDTCGLGNVGLKASVVWLSCTSQFRSGGTFSVLDAAAMHEILHALGAVDEGVPHWFPGGHVADRGDIMDYRALPVDGNGQVAVALDPGRDDYFGHGKSFHTDVADSRYLDSNPISGTPKMRVGSVTRIKAPRGRLTLGARVSNPGPGRVTVRCSAKQGKRHLRVAAARYSSGSALCSFAGVRRGPVGGTITVRSGKLVASRTFRVRG